MSPDKVGDVEKLGLGKLVAGGDRSGCVWFEEPPRARTVLLEEGGETMFLVRRYGFGILCKDLLEYVILGVEPAPALKSALSESTSKIMESLAMEIAKTLGVEKVAIHTAMRQVVAPSPIELWESLSQATKG